jgi:hypothetical protein
MSEVVAGAIPAQSAQQAAIETNPDWLYSVAVTTTNVYGVISVSVTVQRNESSARPARATLVRWMRDPALATADDTTAGATGSSL